MQRPCNPEALRQAPPVGLRHVQEATWQHRVSAWAGSRSVCGQVRTRLGLDMCWFRTPAWVLLKARVCSVLGPWDPIVGGPDPIWEGSGSHSRGPSYTWRSWTNLGGPDYISRGPVLSHGCPDLLLMPWSISPSLDTWRLRTRPCGGVGRRCGPRVAVRDWGESWSGPTHSTLTTRLSDSRVGTTSLYSSKGYPSFRVPTWTFLNPKASGRGCMSIRAT
jgi:hypothetical protein